MGVAFFWEYPDIWNAEGKSAGGEVGEKLVRVVGFGASRDVGGFVLGLNVRGESGRGIKDGSSCLVCGKIRLPYGEVTVDGGEIGIADGGGYVLVRGLMGLDCNGLVNAALVIILGDGGGDGVDVVERNVRPGP